MKVIPILNAVGCVFLVAFIFAQWKMGQTLQKELWSARLAERNTQNEKIELEKRGVQLQTDVDNLKSSLESIRADAEAAKKKAADDDLLINRLSAGLGFSYANFQALDRAIEERNARLEQSNSALVATRNRLDEAISKLKEAGAR